MQETFGAEPALSIMMRSNRPRSSDGDEEHGGVGGPGERAASAPPGEVRPSGVYVSDRPAAAEARPAPRCTSLDDAYRRYRRPVWAALLAGRVEPDAVEDLVEAVFVGLIEQFHEHGMPADVPKLLFDLAAKEARSHRRRRQRHHRRTDAEAEPESVAVPSSRSNPERIYARAAWARALPTAIAEMPARAAALLRRIHFDEVSEKKAAAELNCLHGTVRVRHHRAKNDLRKRVLSHYEKDSR
jgi:RNA polymerase sigma-70 factor, ECF subfamily